MNKRNVSALVMVLVGVGCWVGCGKQAVEYPGDQEDGGFAATSGDAGSSGGAGGSCKSSADCTGGQSCVNGACANGCSSSTQCSQGQVCNLQTATCGPCTANGQCQQGQVCLSGKCVTTCGTSADCTSGQVCVSSVCTPCGPNVQCPSGQACIAGSCGPCQQTSQCPSGQACNANACGPCTSNSQCGPGNLCNLQTGVCQPQGGVDGGIVDGGGDACVGAPVYAVTYPNAPSMWSQIPGVNGAVGLAAGNAACASMKAGTHVCEYQEVRAAAAKGELAALTTTAWLQRTTVEKVSPGPGTNPDYFPDPNSGVTSTPGPGNRCDDWQYQTNHINNGEYVELVAGNAPTYHLAATTQNVPNVATSGASPLLVSRTCGPMGHTRDILCCYAPPAGCP